MTLANLEGRAFEPRPSGEEKPEPLSPDLSQALKGLRACAALSRRRAQDSRATASFAESLEEAGEFYRKGRYREALEPAERALQVARGGLEIMQANETLAGIRLLLGDREGALRAAQDAEGAALLVGGVKVRIKLARLVAQTGDLARAARCSTSSSRSPRTIRTRAPSSTRRVATSRCCSARPPLRSWSWSVHARCTSRSTAKRAHPPPPWSSCWATRTASPATSPPPRRPIARRCGCEGAARDDPPRYRTHPERNRSPPCRLRGLGGGRRGLRLRPRDPRPDPRPAASGDAEGPSEPRPRRLGEDAERCQRHAVRRGGRGAR